MASPLCFLLLAAMASAAETNRWRIMPVGDSITEGSRDVSYRYPLYKKLAAAGFQFEFVGTRMTGSPVGPLRHEGYSGKTVEFLASKVPASLREQVPDMVLVHAGHNHFTQEHPIPGMIAATESLIQSCRSANSNVVILLAKVIPSGKLPKYAYLADLNEALGALAKRLSSPAQPILVVDAAAGFDWHTDTMADRVHPNSRGAQKMADAWFAAMTNFLLAPPNIPARQLSSVSRSSP